MKDSDHKTIIHYFEFLANRYGMRLDVTEKGDSSVVDGVLRYRSPTCEVGLRIESGLLYVTLHPPGGPKAAEVSIDDVVQYMTGKQPTLEHYNKPAHLHQPQGIGEEAQSFAALLDKHCHSLLDGSFDNWRAISRFKLERLRAHYRSLTGLELPEEELGLYLKGRD